MILLYFMGDISKGYPHPSCTSWGTCDVPYLSLYERRGREEREGGERVEENLAPTPAQDFLPASIGAGSAMETPTFADPCTQDHPLLQRSPPNGRR